MLSIEISTGNINWKTETVGTFLLFDYPGNKILSCHSNVIETIDLNDGRLLDKIETNVKKLRHFTAYYCLDDSGVYYGYSANGNPTQLGKISRINGIVEWEYTYVATNPPPNYLRKWYILNNNMHLLYFYSPKDESRMILIDPTSEENKKLSTIINDKITDLGLEMKDRKFPKMH